MKRLYKRLLAVVLCLALTTVIVPATAFAEWKPGPRNEEEAAYCLELGFMPGELSVTLYEQYYTVDEAADKNLADILPEIEIESYLDQYLCVMNEAQKQTIKEKDPEYAAMIGKRFHITLADRTVEATEEAVEALKDNPFVSEAKKVYCYGPDDVLDVIPSDPIGPDDEITVADALYVLRVAARLFTPEAGEDLDKDGDGAVTVADALIVLRIAAKLA